jgi:type I restriction enzyme R subunit
MVKEAKVHLSPLLDSGLNGDYLAVAFDVRIFYIEYAILKTGGINGVNDHIKTIRLIAQYLITEKASVPQVLAKAGELKRVMSESYWNNVNITELESMRESLRDLMQFMKGSGRNKFDIDIEDEVDDADYQPEDTSIDIRTYREKVIDYLVEHSDSPVIQKIHNLEPITNDDLNELERILWHELGTKDDYTETTDIGNLAAFVRSLIGLSQEAVNEKFGEYLSGNLLNSQQQEFVHTIINYVRENGDVELADMVNTEPFNNYDLNEMFGVNLQAIVRIVGVLHNSVVAAAA